MNRRDKGIPQPHMELALGELISAKERLFHAERKYDRLQKQNQCEHHWIDRGVSLAFFDLPMHYFRCSLCGAEAQELVSRSNV